MPRLPIDTDYLADRLRQLLAIPSPTGYTDIIVRACVPELERLNIPAELTRRGAIRAVMQGSQDRPARAIVAHLDTLGAQVKSLKDNGRAAVVPIGHWSARFAEGARCNVFTDQGAYRGSLLPLKASGHTFDTEVDTQPVAWDNLELRIDAFSRTAAELERLGVAIGDIIAIDPQPEFLENGFVVSRHLDDKAGVAVMFAAMEAIRREGVTPTVDTDWLLSISEEIGTGSASLLNPRVAALVAIDNGTSAPGQNSSEFGVTVAMADQTGPFDYHLTQKLLRLCREEDIRHQRDVFRHYRSDLASAIEAGADARTALVTFGVDASHGYERIHLNALRSLAELVTAYVTSPVEIERDARETAGIAGFTTQPFFEAEEARSDRVPEPAQRRERDDG
jgi:peptidase M42 family hydrolase